MKITVAFITRNRVKELIRAIDSCLHQNYKDLNIIVLDNDSDENVKRDLKTQLRKYDNKKIECIYCEKNLGIARGRNYIFKKCEGEIVFFLDDDAVVKSEKFFERASAYFKENENAVCLAPFIYQPQDEKKLVGKVYKDNEVFSFIGAAHFLRKSFWETRQEELYPIDFMFGSEEMYASLTIHRYNKIVGFDSNMIVYHLPSAIARVKGKERKFNMILNTFIIRKMFYPYKYFPLLWAMFILRLIKNRILNISFIYRTYKERNISLKAEKMSKTTFSNMIQKVGFWYLF